MITLFFGNCFSFIYVCFVNSSDTKATTLHCSNAPPIVEIWPTGEPLGFGNSPTQQPLCKVVGGRKLFGEILKRSEASALGQPQLVAELMDLMKQKQKCAIYCYLVKR